MLAVRTDSDDAGRMRALRLLWRYPVITLTVIVFAVVGGLHAAGEETIGRWVATVFVAAVVVWTLIGMVRDVLRGHVGLDILAVVAMVATLAVGEYIAALIIVLMLSGGEALEDFAGRRAKRDLSALLDRSPRSAHVLTHPEDADSDAAREAPVDDVAVGDVLLVRPAEIIPVDGELLTDSASFDESSLTGESLPVTRGAGDEVLSGAINGSRAIRLRALRTGADSQYQQIVALVAEAESSHAPIVRLADRFAIPFTAVALVLAGTAWALSGDATRFAEVLVLATPCPLLIAAPVAFLGGLSRAAKSGVIMKSGAVIEQIARVRSAAFDKTGTLTQGGRSWSTCDRPAVSMRMRSCDSPPPPSSTRRTCSPTASVVPPPHGAWPCTGRRRRARPRPTGCPRRSAAVRSSSASRPTWPPSPPTPCGWSSHRDRPPRTSPWTVGSQGPSCSPTPPARRRPPWSPGCGRTRSTGSRC